MAKRFYLIASFGVALALAVPVLAHGQAIPRTSGGSSGSSGSAGGGGVEFRRFEWRRGRSGIGRDCASGGAFRRIAQPDPDGIDERRFGRHAVRAAVPAMCAAVASTAARRRTAPSPVA